MLRLEFEGKICVRSTNEGTPYYMIALDQKQKSGKYVTHYLNAFFKKDTIIPDDGTIVKGMGWGTLFKDQKSGKSRVSLNDVEIIENVGQKMNIEANKNPYLLDDDEQKIDDLFSSTNFDFDEKI